MKSIKQAAKVNCLRPTMTEDAKQKFLAVMRGMDFSKFWYFCQSEDEISMNPAELRNQKGGTIEKLVARFSDGSHIDGRGCDVSWIDGEVYGELKYERKSSRKTITRKLKNSLSLNGRAECDIGFDVLFVLSPEYITAYFSDEMNGKVFTVSDGFEFRADFADGHLIATSNLPKDVLYCRKDQLTLGEAIVKTTDDFVNNLAKKGNPYTPVARSLLPRSGSKRRQSNLHYTIAAR
jgi:hypothetical protein